MLTMGLLSLSLVAGALTAAPTSAPAPAPTAAEGPHASVTSLMSKDLINAPGREVTMITVDYPPGSVDPIHRHDAQGFIYVLEGSIVMQVKGGPQVTLKPGDTYYEGPDDIHVIGKNASQTAPAKFVVVFIKKKGAPILTPTEVTPSGSSR